VRYSRIVPLSLCLVFALIQSSFTMEVSGTHEDRDSTTSIQITSGFIEIVGGKLFYEQAGTGVPVVMIHDELLHREIWDEQFSVFAEDYRVIRYDRRGYGRSSQPFAFYSNLDDLHILFETLKIDRAHIIGISAGGGLAIDYTLAHPERVLSLVLVGPVVSGLGFSDHFVERGGHLREADRESEESLRQYWFKRDPYIIALENDSVRRKAQRLIESNPHNTDSKNYRLERGMRQKAIDKLEEIQVPVLIVVGEHDIPDVHAHAGALEAGIPDAARIIIRDAGHLVPMERPEEFNKLVTEFLKSIPSE